MNIISIKTIKKWVLKVIITICPLSLIGNILLIKNCFYFQFMPIPDAEVTKAFESASPETIAARTFSLKWGKKYYLVIETTKEVKEKLEKLERNK